MPISNPCNWFSTGGNSDDQREFISENGAKLYNFCPHDCGLSKTMEMNVIFFANSPEHAKQLLEEMLNFRIICEKNYKEVQGNYSVEGRAGMKYAQTLLDNKDKWIIEEAPMNQFYVVGWASNNTIL